jgi:hypothetical protein
MKHLVARLVFLCGFGIAIAACAGRQQPVLPASPSLENPPGSEVGLEYSRVI